MALWRKNTALSKSKTEQKRKRKEREKDSIVQKGAFYHYWEPLGFRTTERMESADNRRAAGIYVRNF